MKEYQKPELEIVSLMAEESITSLPADIDTYGVDFSIGLGENIFNQPQQ